MSNKNKYLQTRAGAHGPLGGCIYTYAIPTYFFYFYPFYCISSYFSIPYGLMQLILCKRGYEILFYFLFFSYYLSRMVI